jgi:hypothetical protein
MQEEINGSPEPAPSGQFNPFEEESFVQRHGFSHAMIAVLWVAVGFILFQIVGGIVGAIAIISVTPDISDMDDIMAAFTERLDLVFIGNSFAQLTVIFGVSLLLVRLHAVKGERKAFIRWQKGNQTMLVSALTVVLIIAAQPVVALLGWLNAQIPVPEFFSEAQNTMLEMITSFLKTENALILGFIHIGLVPSLCEEVMFRGYLMRALEKSGGIIVALVVSSLLFGAFHLQLTNLLPLATLGFLLAYVTWITDSLIPAMIAHLVNNGGQVIIGSIYPSTLDLTQPDQFDIPVYLVVLSFVVTGVLLYVMINVKRRSLTSKALV